MKIIHCADLHLDSSYSGIGKDISKKLRQNMLVVVRDMYQHAHQIGARAVIIAGDIFDTQKISVNTRTYLLDTFRQYSDIITVILPGNHDGDMVFAQEEIPSNVYCFDHNLTAIAIDNVVIAGKVLSTANAKQLPLQLQLDSTKYNILVLHGQESNYNSEDDVSINIPALRNLNIDYLALGHIHTHKVAQLDNRAQYCYSGCLAGRGFDECGDKGYVVLDTTTNSTQFVKASNIVFATVAVDISNATSLKEIELLIEGKLSHLGKDSLVKVVLHGSYTIDMGKDIGALVAMFASRYLLFKIDDKSTLHIDIADYTHDISLRGEFVKLVGGDNSIIQQQREAILEYGIRALKGEDIT